MKVSLLKGKFLIESDSLQFVVKRQKITQESRLTKIENVGKISYEDIGYFTKLDNAFTMCWRSSCKRCT